jgi:hypothetical protein
MKVFNAQCIFVDVGDTLILWGRPWSPDSIAIACCGRMELLEPHKLHIDYLKRAKKNGNCIVVWSSAGAEWASEVVEALSLKKYVDVILAKPSAYIDDQCASEILPEAQRIFLPQRA